MKQLERVYPQIVERGAPPPAATFAAKPEELDLLSVVKASQTISGEVERMFEPFAQADQGLARTHGGLGLGLAVAKRLVEMHGGRIRGASAGRGRGSEFLVLLPLLGCEEAMRVPAAPDERHASAPS